MSGQYPTVHAIEMFRGADELWRVTLSVGGSFWAVIIPPGSLDAFRRAGVPMRINDADVRGAQWKEPTNG